MSNTMVIDVQDISVPVSRSINIAVINKPNPVTGYTANADEVYQLINIPKYRILVSGTDTPVTGENYYTYFPEKNPWGGGGGGGGGDSYTKAETDTLLYGKVDKVTGKGLSTNDFTNEDKTKVTNAVSTQDVQSLIDTSQTAQEQSLVPITAQEIEDIWNMTGVIVQQIKPDGQYIGQTLKFDTIAEAASYVNSHVAVGATWKITIANDVKEEISANMFKDNETISWIIVGSGVTSIGSGAFQAMTALKQLEIYAHIDSTTSSIAYNCTALETVILTDCPTLPPGILASTKATNITFPSNLTTIKGGALSNIAATKLDFMGTQIETIENGGVYSQTLSSVELPSSITTIGQGGFGGCSGITFTIHKSTEVSGATWGASNSTVNYVN